MTKVYSVSNFIQKHFIGGYELYAKQNLRAKNKRLSEASEINAVGPEDSNGGIDATIVDEENGILFDVKLRELPEGELPTEKSLKKSSIFELKSEDGKTKKFLISNAVAKLLKEQPKIDGDHLYMMDLDESAEFDANVASSSDCYKPSTYLSLLTGEKSYAVAAGKGNRNDTFSTAGTGSNRTAAAKFIDPLAELIKPEMKQYGDNSNEKSVLKGPLSKSRVMVSFLIASVFIMGALLFLTFGGAPILGIGIMATIPLYVALPAAIGPFGLAVVLNIFSKPYVEKTLTKRHKVYNFIANPANKAVLVYSAVSVLIALVVMPFFGPLTFAVAGFSVLMLIASRVDAAKGRSLASGTFMFFAVTPWLMGAVRYLITSGILLKPLAAGLAWVYERITNWNFHTKMSRPSQYVAIFLYFIGSFLVGLLSGVAGIFGIKIPLSRVNFDQTEYGKDARDTCHWIAVHIAANVGRLLVLSLVISTVVMTIAYTSGIAALISGIGSISSMPVVGPIMYSLFTSGPMSFFLSSTASVVSVVLGGTGFSIFLAYPMLREVWTLLKELARFNSPVAGGVIGLAGLLAGLVFPPIGLYVFAGATLYFLITMGRLMLKMDRTKGEDNEDEAHQKEIVGEPVVIKEGEDHLETHPKEIIIQEPEESIQDVLLRNPVNLGRSGIVDQVEEHQEEVDVVHHHHDEEIIDNELLPNPSTVEVIEKPQIVKAEQEVIFEDKLPEHHEIEEPHGTIVVERESEPIEIERPEESFKEKMIESSVYSAEHDLEAILIIDDKQELDLDNIYLAMREQTKEINLELEFEEIEDATQVIQIESDIEIVNESEIFEIVREELKNIYTPGLQNIAKKLHKAGLPIHTSYVSPEKVKYISSNEKENEYLAEITAMFNEAEHSIAISSLSAPAISLDSLYYKAFVDGIQTIAHKNRERGDNRAEYIPIVMVFGNAPSILGSGVEFNPDTYMAQLLQGIPEELHPFLKLEIAAYNPQMASWNHSKIIVIDGKKINVGGINLFDEYNATSRRPRDLAVTIEDAIMAREGEKFIQNLINKKAVNILNSSCINKSNIFAFLHGKLQKIATNKFTHFNPKALWNGEKQIGILKNPAEFSNIDIVHSHPPVEIPELMGEELIEEAKRHNVLSVPTYGLDVQGLQPSEVVALEVIRSATKTLKISQQSILFMYGGDLGQYLKGGYSSLIMSEIRTALERGVKVDILISADQCKADNGNDYNGMPIQKLRETIMKDLDPKFANFANLLEIRNTRNADGTEVPNHTKMVMADDKLITIGSHNSYDKSHAEYTQFLEGEEFGKRLNEVYWQIEWDKAEEKFSIIELLEEEPVQLVSDVGLQKGLFRAPLSSELDLLKTLLVEPKSRGKREESKVFPEIEKEESAELNNPGAIKPKMRLEEIFNEKTKEPKKTEEFQMEYKATKPADKRYEPMIVSPKLKDMLEEDRKQRLGKLAEDMLKDGLIVSKIKFWSKIPSFNDVERTVADELKKVGEDIYDLTLQEYEEKMYEVAMQWKTQIIAPNLNLSNSETGDNNPSLQLLLPGVPKHNVNESSEIKTDNVESKFRPKFQITEIRENLQLNGKEDEFTSKKDRQKFLYDLENQLKSDRLIKGSWNILSKAPTFTDVYNSVTGADTMGPIKLGEGIRYQAQHWNNPLVRSEISE